MLKALRPILSSLVLAVLFALTVLNGCGGSATPVPDWAKTSAEQLTQTQLQQMLADSLDKYQKLATYKFNIGMDYTTNATGGTDPWSVVLNTTIGGGTNIAEKQTLMQLEMAIAMTGMGQDNEQQSLAYDMYAMPDWLYMKMSITGVSDQWLKVAMSDNIKKTLNLDAADQQLQMLQTPDKVEYLRTETVGGVVCYVLSVSPNSKKLAKWLEQQNVNAGLLDWESLVNDADVFTDFSLLYYVAKDTNLMTRMVMKMNITFSGAELETAEFDQMRMNVNMDMTLSEHNQPFSVTLPDEAQSAKEVSEEVFNSN